MAGRLGRVAGGRWLVKPQAASRFVRRESSGQWPGLDDSRANGRALPAGPLSARCPRRIMLAGTVAAALQRHFPELSS